jgi:transposase
VLSAEFQAMQTLVASIEKRIMAQHRKNDASQRLETIPGIGFIGATGIAATVTDPTAFRSGRDFAAWIGLVPRQDSTGGKQKLGPISKQGDRYLRRILVVGPTRSCASRSRTRKNIPGSRSFWRDDPSRS